MRFRAIAVLYLLAAALGGCATSTGITVAAGTICDTGTFRVDDAFIGARRGDCQILSAKQVRLFIVREDDKVTNPSPWYAFRLAAEENTTVRVTLDYGEWKHRYVPKISRDGKTWQVAPDEAYTQRSDNTLDLTLRLRGEALWIAAHPIIAPEDYEAWLRTLAHDGKAGLSIAGHSIAGLPIYKLESGRGNAEVLFLTGRQHPPEVSGGVAMKAFVDTLYADTELAGAFRERFRIVSLPLMNPDGVIDGHWRHNLGEIDLNRDWGPFSQPETAVIKKTLDELDSEGGQLRMFIDFHSTRDNRFYTQAEPTNPPGFSGEWLRRAGTRIENYPFLNDPRPQSDTANGKNYMYKRYGIPSLTYEVADEEESRDAAEAAQILAEELMRLWLETPPSDTTARMD